MNSTCIHVNGTALPSHCSPAAVGLPVGLSLFFLLLAGVVVLVLYTQRRRLRDRCQSKEVKNKTLDSQTQQDTSPRYAPMMRSQMSEQGPLYENFKAQPFGRTSAVINMNRSVGEPEDDLYLNCDAPDEAIYSNDPACNLSMLPDDDLYIMPDAL